MTGHDNQNEVGGRAFKILTRKATGRELYEVLGIDGKTNRIYFKTGANTRNLIDSAQVRDYWRVLRIWC